MKKKTKILIYLLFFVVLVGGFLTYVYNWAFTDEMRNGNSKLKVINDRIPDFQLTDQNGMSFTKKNTEGKVYVAEYFFTTCKGICPKMNANMRRIYDRFKDNKDFLIASHTCQPEVDSTPLLKGYETRMIKGALNKKDDGAYSIQFNAADSAKKINNGNWFFLTGDKTQLYNLARTGYIIDNGKPDSTQRIENQFIHSQFFALMDKYGRLRGVYDGLKNNEVEALMNDIQDLLDEKIDHTRFLNGFSNSPN